MRGGPAQAVRTEARRFQYLRIQTGPGEAEEAARDGMEALPGDAAGGTINRSTAVRPTPGAPAP